MAQSEASKLIKRINTNIKAIGVKYGKNSIQYRTAVLRASEVFDDATKSTSITKSGYFSIRNIKRNQQADIQARLRELANADEMSVSNLRRASRQRIQALSDQERERAYEEARERLKAKGTTKPTQKQVESEAEEHETQYVAGFDYVLRTTDKWYAYASQGNEELQRVKDLIKTKGRRKEYSEIQDIIETVNKEVDEIERKNKQGYKEAHDPDTGFMMSGEQGHHVPNKGKKAIKFDI